MIEKYNLNSLLPYQIKELINILNKLLDNYEKDNKIVYEIVRTENSRVFCPFCHSLYIVKDGHTKKGNQTYLCKDCHTRFNNLTSSLFHHTHLSYKQISKFFECIRDKFSIRKTAKLMNVSTRTVFILRHKVLDILKNVRENIKLHGIIEADEYYESINLKGTKTEDMPRASKPRKTKGTGSRGINKHKICIETCIDEYDNSFLEIVGTGPITSEMVEKSLLSKIYNVKKFITDCKSSYESFAKKNNINLIQIKSGTYKNSNGDTLANVNQLQSGLESFLSHFHGVSSKHLQHYLDWYSFDKYINYTVEVLEQTHDIESTVITKNTDISYKNVYGNNSDLDFDNIYSDYNYHAKCTT